MATEGGIERPRAAQAEENNTDSRAEQIYVAPQWLLMWWKFRKHRMAMVSGVVLIFFYLTVIFCEFVAPYDPELFSTRYTLAPPTKIYIFDTEGQLHFPFVYGVKRDRDPVTLRPVFVEDTTVIKPIKLFVRGTPYRLGRYSGRYPSVRYRNRS